MNLPLANRGIGEVETLANTLPDWVVAMFGLITRLGDGAVVVMLLVFVYWFHRRRSGAFAIGAILGALALTVVLKTAFGLPRPPSSLHAIPTDGYGFPSGHAIAATVAWGLLALVSEVDTQRRRVGVAVIVITLVAISRVVLGVHYGIDVVAGVVIGVAYLVVVVRWGNDDPRRVFGLAIILAVVGGMIGGGRDAAVLFGAAFGGFVGWSISEIPVEAWGREGVGPAIGALAIIGVVVGIRRGLVSVTPLVGADVAMALTTAVAGIAGAIVVALPSVVDRS